MEFGEKLKKLRLERNMTQTQVAEYIGVTYQTCLSYEAGKSYPRRSGILTKLSELFDCEPDDLFSEKHAFEARAEKAYGTRNTKNAYLMVDQLAAMMEGNELSEADKDTILEKLQTAYWNYRKSLRKRVGRRAGSKKKD